MIYRGLELKLRAMFFGVLRVFSVLWCISCFTHRGLL